MKLRISSVLTLALVSGNALADVTFYDNSDLTFVLSPFENSATFGPHVNDPYLVQTTLYPLSSPAHNTDGVATGMHTISYKIGRHPPSGSSVEEDLLRGSPAGSVRFGYTGNWLMYSAELTTHNVGDTVDESAFTTQSGFFEYLGAVANYQLGAGTTPLYGDETYIPVSFEEAQGIRYGYLRITYMEDIKFERVDEFNIPTGETVLRDAYMVTGWGFESELDTPAVVTDGTITDCLADVNGDGVATPADFTAWINAFNNNLPECDQNGDNACTPTDFTAWVNNFNNGC